MQINEKIRQARVAKGWSQQQIAEKLEESRSSYAEWERETIPRADILVKIASITGISILKFIEALDEKVARDTVLDQIGELKVLNMNPEIKVGELSMAERLIARLEADNADAKADKEKLFSILADAQRTINEVLKPIKESINHVKTNSETIKADLAHVQRMIRADDLSIMKGTDKILGREPGATAREAGILERVFGQDSEDIDTQDDERKPGRKGKLKK